MDFDEWFQQVKALAVNRFRYTRQSVDSFDADAWRIYYDDGETPRGAILEELSHE